MGHSETASGVGTVYGKLKGRGKSGRIYKELRGPVWRLDPRKGKLVLRLQASVFTSVNWDEPRVPRRTKPHKGLDINSQGARYGWLLCRHNPDRSCYSFLLPPCSQVWCGLPTSPHPSLSASPLKARPSADAAARVLWSPRECLQPWLHQLSWKDKPFFQPKVALAQGHTRSQGQSLIGLAPGPQVGSLTLQANDRS